MQHIEGLAEHFAADPGQEGCFFMGDLARKVDGSDSIQVVLKPIQLE